MTGSHFHTLRSIPVRQRQTEGAGNDCPSGPLVGGAMAKASGPDLRKYMEKKLASESSLR